MESKKVLTYGLLLSVILIWALSWPISKLGLMDMPPMWYSAFRLVVGFVTIFIILLFQKKIKIPKKQDIPLIMSIGLLQMACFLILINGGLLFVDAGRSAILVYSTPFLITPIAVLFFDERLTKAKLIGLLLGGLGILLLFNPWTFNWHDHHTLIGNVLLLLAAVCWAVAMLHTRYGIWHSPSIQLVPWQLLIAGFFVIMACLILNPHPQINWNSRLIWTGLYNGILATGFAYAAIIYVSQKLPVINTSLLLLGVPVAGLVFSSLLLSEKLTWVTSAALALIISGLIAIAMDKSTDIKA
ncbi:MAG: DMT family transporter [Gammaproteobacteria bacterium]|nr:DMT family transporter [Gammaproteobacteria bacterium]